MDVVAVLFGVGIAVLALSMLRKKPSRLPVILNDQRSEAEQLNVDGDGVALLARLSTLPLGEFVPYATALGLYAESIEAVQPTLPKLDVTVFLESLVRVNTAEPLSELGRYDEALALLDFTSEFPLVEGGRRCSKALGADDARSCE